ncbi:hypothetical protein CapIbe_003062 [Capra ibex]
MWTGWPWADRLGLVGWLGLWLGGSSLLPARRRAVLTAPADAGPCVWAAACPDSGLLASSSESIAEATAEARGPRRWEWWRSSLNSSPPPLPPQNCLPGAGLSPFGLGRIPQAWPPGCPWARKSQPIQERPGKGKPSPGQR